MGKGLDGVCVRVWGGSLFVAILGKYGVGVGPTRPLGEGLVGVAAVGTPLSVRVSHAMHAFPHLSVTHSTGCPTTATMAGLQARGKVCRVPLPPSPT